MRTGWIGSVLLGALLLVGLPLGAQPGPGGPPADAPRGGGRQDALAGLRFEAVDRLAGPLGLTAEQRTKLKQELATRTREAIRLGGQLQLQQFDLLVLLDASKPDTAQAHKLQDAVQGTEAALARHRLDTVLALKAILTPEQQDKLEALSAQLQSRPGVQQRPGSGARPGGQRPGGAPGGPQGPPPGGN